MELQCEECNHSFQDRKGTKYCKPCRQIVKARGQARRAKGSYVYKANNFCNSCGIKIAKYQQVCDNCKYRRITCLYCHQQLNVLRHGAQIFCSRRCRSLFYHADVPHNKIVELAKQLQETKEKWALTQALLRAQQITTGDFMEQNQRLKQRLKEFETIGESPTTGNVRAYGKYKNRTIKEFGGQV